MSEYRSDKSDGRLIFGLILVGLGALWLLDNLDIIPYVIPYYLISWKTFLIGLGVYFIIGRKKPEPGIIMIAIGGVFLLQDLHFFRVRDIWHIFWPVAIIAVGLSLIIRRRHGTIAEEVDREKKKSNIDYIDDTAIFGGRERMVNSQNFLGGKLTTIFGGSEINMRDAELSDGVNVLDVFVIFGGTEIMVPPDWTVEVDVFSIFGAFSDNRKSAVKVVPNKDKVLRIKGFVLFGGGELRL